MQTKVKIWVYVLSGLVLYFVGAMSSLMYENGLSLNIAWNWALKGSSQIQGFMMIGAILTFVWMDLILHLVRIRQWIYLVIFSVLFIIAYFISHYLFFLLLGIFGLGNLAYLGFIKYKENKQMVVEEKIVIQEDNEQEQEEKLIQDTEVEVEKPEEIEEQESIDLLQDEELHEKIDALFKNEEDVEVDVGKVEESSLTIDFLTEDYEEEKDS